MFRLKTTHLRLYYYNNSSFSASPCRSLCLLIQISNDYKNTVMNSADVETADEVRLRVT